MTNYTHHNDTDHNYTNHNYTNHDHTLTAAGERRLARRARGGDLAARDELVHRNQGLVASIALEYRRLGVDIADLRQEGFIGLMQAVGRFDPDRGTRLSTYAVPWIRRAVLESVRAQESGPRVPSGAKRALRNMTATAEALEARLRRRPSVKELAAETDTSPARALALLEAKPQPVALDAETDNASPAIEQLVASEGDPAGEVERAAVSTAVWTAVADLPLGQRKVIGFHSGAGLSLSRVASRLGITPSAVAESLQAALLRLRPQLQRVL